MEEGLAQLEVPRIPERSDPGSVIAVARVGHFRHRIHVGDAQRFTIPLLAPQ